MHFGQWWASRFFAGVPWSRAYLYVHVQNKTNKVQKFQIYYSCPNYSYSSSVEICFSVREKHLYLFLSATRLYHGWRSIQTHLVMKILINVGDLMSELWLYQKIAEKKILKVSGSGSTKSFYLKMKQSCTRPKNFDVCFCWIFDCYWLKLISGEG